MKASRTRTAPLTHAFDVGGRKDDGGKLRWDLIPYACLEEVAKVYTHGATKYSDWNWAQGIHYSRLFAALMRHLGAFWFRRESYDQESGCHHLAAATFYTLALMHYDLKTTSGAWDDRHE